MTLLQSIGAQIKTLRLALGLNQSGLANRMGTSRAYISGVETGKESLSLEQVEKFAQALNATPLLTLHPNGGGTIEKTKLALSIALDAANVAQAFRDFGEAVAKHSKRFPPGGITSGTNEGGEFVVPRKKASE